MTTTIDRAGRLVIPKEMRERVGLTAGSTVTIREQDGRVEIEPAYQESRLIEGPHGLLMIEAPPGAQKITNDQVRSTLNRIRREREERIMGTRSDS